MVTDSKYCVHACRVLVASVMMLGGIACAQSQSETKPAAGAEERMAARFAQADKNKDGSLSLEEAQAGMPRAAEHFSAIDADGNSAITLEELRQARAAMQH